MCVCVGGCVCGGGGVSICGWDVVYIGVYAFRLL